MTLKDLSLHELWELFPIQLSPFNPMWKSQAEEEICSLTKQLGPYITAIHHIGSTAIDGIYSKPIVDILIETKGTDEWNRITGIMESSGYLLMSRSELRMSFNKGYTLEGYSEKVFHIHFHITGDNREIMFRDYLIDHPSAAFEYEKLKLSLLPGFTHDRDGYTAAKSDFIDLIHRRAECESEITESQLAKLEFLSRKASLSEIRNLARWASESDENKDFLWRMTSAPDRHISFNSLWSLTHSEDEEWLRALQSRIILRLLTEKHEFGKRMCLQLLKRQNFNTDTPLCVALLNYCLSKINSECEPYAVRCFSMYVAYEISKDYPELVAELEEYLNLLEVGVISPGLKSGLRQIREKIAKRRNQTRRTLTSPTGSEPTSSRGM